MSFSVRLLLPVLDLEALDLFGGLPAEALLRAGNLPALQGSRVLCLLAPGPVIDRFKSTERFKALAAHAEVQTIAVDDLVLDQSFDVVPSLAYMRGIAAAGTAATGTCFIFLQDNLILAEGSLRSVVDRLGGDARVVTATYLRADQARLSQRLANVGQDDLAARSLFRHVHDCLDVRDLASIVNSEQALGGPPGRFFWRHGEGALVARDFMPSLVALRPTIAVQDVPGFRDVAFAAALCPDQTVHHVEDSDRFLGVELTRATPEANVSVWRQTNRQASAELSAWTTVRQRAAAANHVSVFHGDDVPPGLPNVVGDSDAHIKALVSVMGPPQPEFEHPHWQLARYLWKVRSFELGRGPLPPSLFERLLGHAPTVVELQQGPPQADRSGAAMKLLRVVRQTVLGRIPLVTFLHPNWIEFRAVMPALRAARRMRREDFLYIGDGAALLAGVLGAPAYVSTHLLDGTYEVDRTQLRLVVMELSSSAVESWSELVRRTLPAMAPGGQIVVFHRTEGSYNLTALKRSLALGAIELRGHKELTMALAGGSRYQDWLRHGFEVALGLGRTRRPKAMAKGGVLLGLVGALNVLSNFAHVVGSRNAEPAADAQLSVTIIVTAKSNA